MRKLNFLAIALSVLMTTPVITTAADTGSSNPLLTPSKLPYQAPPFDKIKDEDYQPAIEAGMAEQLKEMQAIANNPAPPTFENTIVAMEKSGRTAESRDCGRSSRSPGPTPIRRCRRSGPIEAPKLAAHRDAIFLDAKLFQRVAAIYKQTAFAEARSGIACAWWSTTTTSSSTPEPISAKPTRPS